MEYLNCSGFDIKMIDVFVFLRDFDKLDGIEMRLLST